MMWLWCSDSYMIYISDSSSEGGLYIDYYIVPHEGLGWTFGYSHSQMQINSISMETSWWCPVPVKDITIWANAGVLNWWVKSRSQDHFPLVFAKTNHCWFHILCSNDITTFRLKLRWVIMSITMVTVKMVNFVLVYVNLKGIYKKNVCKLFTRSLFVSDWINKPDIFIYCW